MLLDFQGQFFLEIIFNKMTIKKSSTQKDDQFNKQDPSTVQDNSSTEQENPIYQDFLNYSSIETQRELRIEKIKLLKARGIDPFPSDSFRDFDLSFVRFWSNFILKFDFELLNLSDHSEWFLFDHFLEQVLFPLSLLEQMEDKLAIRNAVREMGFDPDNLDNLQKEEFSQTEEFDPELVNTARNLIPDFTKYSEEEKVRMKELLIKDLENYQEIYEYSDLNLKTKKLALEDFLSLKNKQIVTLTGRIKSKRVVGKIAFATIEDENSTLQFIFKKDSINSSLDKEELKTNLEELIKIFS